MGKTTIYLNKESEEIYKKAKEYAAGNLSHVIVQSLKLYVDKMETTEKGMKEVVIFVGKYFPDGDISQGKNLKFIGRLIAEGSTDYGQGDQYTRKYFLYLTRKGKFLVEGAYFSREELAEITYYKVYDTFLEIMQAGYPAEMLEEARKKMPEVACEELDV